MAPYQKGSTVELWISPFPDTRLVIFMAVKAEADQRKHSLDLRAYRCLLTEYCSYAGLGPMTQVWHDLPSGSLQTLPPLIPSLVQHGFVVSDLTVLCIIHSGSIHEASTRPLITPIQRVVSLILMLKP